MEAFRAATIGKEALAELFGVEFGFGIALSRFIHCSIGQAEHDPPDHTQDQRGIRGPYPAQIFLHRDVQAVVQAAFNDPVLPFELQHA